VSSNLARHVLRLEDDRTATTVNMSSDKDLDNSAYGTPGEVYHNDNRLNLYTIILSMTPTLK